jgi:hypothetical protein
MDNPKYLVRSRHYLCHPETCGHTEHYDWWITEDGHWYAGFNTPEEADQYIENWLTFEE